MLLNEFMSAEDIEKLRVEIEKIIDDSKGEEWHTDENYDEYRVEVIEPSTASFRIIDFLKKKEILK